MDKMREEFEELYNEYSGGRHEWIAEGVYKRMRRGHTYDNIIMQVAWEWFKKGQAALQSKAVTSEELVKLLDKSFGSFEKQAQAILTQFNVSKKEG